MSYLVLHSIFKYFNISRITSNSELAPNVCIFLVLFSGFIIGTWIICGVSLFGPIMIFECILFKNYYLKNAHFLEVALFKKEDEPSLVYVSESSKSEWAEAIRFTRSNMSFVNKQASCCHISSISEEGKHLSSLI